MSRLSLKPCYNHVETVFSLKPPFRITSITRISRLPRKKSSQARQPGECEPRSLELVRLVLLGFSSKNSVVQLGDLGMGCEWSVRGSRWIFHLEPGLQAICRWILATFQRGDCFLMSPGDLQQLHPKTRTQTDRRTTNGMHSCDSEFFADWGLELFLDLILNSNWISLCFFFSWLSWGGT